MATNLRKQKQNKMPVRSLSPWVLVAVIALASAMPWVYFKNQLVTGGKEQRAMEEELVALRARNKVLKARIATLSSRKALQERLAEGLISMVPLEGQHIVQLGHDGSVRRAVAVLPAAGAAPRGNVVQPVANKGGRRP